MPSRARHGRPDRSPTDTRRSSWPALRWGFLAPGGWPPKMLVDCGLPPHKRGVELEARPVQPVRRVRRGLWTGPGRAGLLLGRGERIDPPGLITLECAGLLRRGISPAADRPEDGLVRDSNVSLPFHLFQTTALRLGVLSISRRGHPCPLSRPAPVPTPDRRCRLRACGGNKTQGEGQATINRLLSFPS